MKCANDSEIHLHFITQICRIKVVSCSTSIIIVLLKLSGNKFGETEVKNGPQWLVFSSIRMIPRGMTTKISVASQPSMAQSGRFLGPRVPKWTFHFLHLTQKERCVGRAKCTQVTLFPHNYWVFKLSLP